MPYGPSDPLPKGTEHYSDKAKQVFRSVFNRIHGDTQHESRAFAAAHAAAADHHKRDQGKAHRAKLARLAREP